MSMKRFFAAATLAVVLAACGGGGGNGGADDDPAQVRLAVAPAAKLQAQAYEGEGYSASVRVDVEGELASLNGKTIYVVTDVSGELFQRPPSVEVYGTQPYADVVFAAEEGEVPLPGTYEGTATIHACYDAACQSELGGSPVKVPYTVTIHPALALSQAVVERTVAFGVKPETVRIAVQLPAGATSWDLFGGDLGGAAYWVEKAPDGSPNIDVHFGLVAPGTHSETVMVSTVAPALAGESGRGPMQKSFSISYTVQDAAPSMPIAFDPIGAHWEFTQGSDQQGNELFVLVSAEGSVDRVGTVYLSAPPAAAGNPNSSAWLFFGSSLSEYVVVPCATPSEASACLPVGDYTAAIRFRHTSPEGLVTDVDYPISMTIKP